ncbi:hypothetical protein [Vagococcus humatus]|uniref:DUF2178 domain-containing protein n=1 Tax=Vagococcus humatus TaxID=1889241 RepID=A0A429Z6D4_9ENTE|nr:hypothetical protein [Vagococcus humatus]RST89229.1 hypothetical protein C7P63_05490 [Vagococcus humatus]
MGRIVIELICSVLMLVSIGGYFKLLAKYRNQAEGFKILANASQVTFSAFIIGFALIMIWINVLGLTRGKFILSMMYHATFVSVVNVLSILYYSKTLDSKK